MNYKLFEILVCFLYPLAIFSYKISLIIFRMTLVLWFLTTFNLLFRLFIPVNTKYLRSTLFAIIGGFQMLQKQCFCTILLNLS